VSKLAAIPSMPRSVAENSGFFERYNLADRVDLIGIDYLSRTMNLYFAPPAECLEEKTILAMHRDIGLPNPSERMTDFCANAFGLYTTISWDSPKIEQFVKNLPYGVDDPKMVYAAVTSTGEEYHKLQTYIRWKSLSRLNVGYIRAAGEEQA
jgi:hypothetical protein